MTTATTTNPATFVLNVRQLGSDYAFAERFTSYEAATDYLARAGFAIADYPYSAQRSNANGDMFHAELSINGRTLPLDGFEHAFRFIAAA